MSTATKLEYLNDTKQLLKENINNLGGNLTNEPFRQYASVLEGIYESLPKVNGIGASLSLSPSMVGKIKLNEIQGDTLQNGTPTPDTPVPIQSVTGLQNVEVCGKNLFDKTKNIVDGLTFGPSGELLNNTNFFYQNYYIPVQPNTTYSVSKTTGNNSLRICEYDSSKTFIKRNYEKHTITTSATTYFIRISNYKVQIDAMQLEQGSTATTYEPYKGNTYEVNLGTIELNKIGTYEDSIKKSTGKNLVYEIEQGSFNYQTGAFSTNANIIRTKKIPVKPNTTYTISSKLALGECCTYFYENDGTTGIAGSLLISTTTVKTISFTTPNNAYYMIFRLGASSVPYSATDDNNIMLNEGTALPYEPYGKVWYVEKNIGKVVLNGSENWTNFTTVASSSNTMSQIDLPMQFLNRDGYTDRFPVIPDYSATEHFVIAGGLTHLYVHILNSRLSSLDVAGFKSWLASNNTTFYYVLKSPIYEVITNTELIEQLETLSKAKSKNGTTNINVDGSLPVILGVKVLKGE